MTGAQIYAYFIAPLVLLAAGLGIAWVADWRARHDIDPHQAAE